MPTCEHYFPEPEELGIDPDAVPWTRGNCACGAQYVEHDLDDLAAQIAPGIAEEHGNSPAIAVIVAATDAYLAEHGIALELGDFELLTDNVKDLVPTYTLTAS